MKENFKLNNDLEIPAVGFGTWQMADGEEVIQAVKKAVQNGYRHIDTAAVYKNEKGVGIGIKECGVARDELFITSKVWNTERGFEKALAAFDKTMQDLQLDYLDLYLLHWPASAKQYKNWQDVNAATWRALEQLQTEGKIKSIGVSNFLPHHLEPLLAEAKIKPAVNQIEYHPGYKQVDCLNFCKDHNIQVEGWSPLGRGRVLENESLQAIAAKHDKSVAQICLRWALQQGILPLPKSVTPSRIKENFELFDFEISESEMTLINELGEFGQSGFHPDEVDF